MKRSDFTPLLAELNPRLNAKNVALTATLILDYMSTSAGRKSKDRRQGGSSCKYSLHFNTRKELCWPVAMSKVIFISLLAVVSNSVMAEWVILGTNDNRTTSVYADPSTIAKNGDIVKMWSMIDFKKAVKLSDGKQFLSWQTQYEFDCKIKQSRMLAASMYSENMGGGEITNSLDYESPKGEAVLADSNGEVLWNYACRRGYQSEQDAQKHCPSDTVVWFNFATGVIHYKGQHWYGRTKDSAYVCKNEAVKKSVRNSRIVQ